MDKYMIRYYKIAGRNHIFYMCFLSRKHSKASALQTFGLIKLNYSVTNIFVKCS